MTNVKTVSDTAFWVAHYRALESEKPNALFHDPLAALLSGEHGQNVSGAMQAFEHYAYWSVTIRTRLIDELLLQYISQGYKTIINLGTGLDTRPYRLQLPADIEWIEVDLPQVIEYKQEKLKSHAPRCRLERIALDLSDPIARANLFNELNQRPVPALVLTEGVVPYLDETEVASLAADIHQQPGFQLWITEYYAPELYPRFQAESFKSRLGDAPFKFFPADWFGFFENHGWASSEVCYLHDVALRHGRHFPLPWWASIIRSIVGEKRMMQKVGKFSAYVALEKKTVD